MSHRLWTVQDVVLHVVGFLDARDAIRLLQTCSTLYTTLQTHALWLALLDGVRRTRDLPLFALGHLADRSLSELKILLRRVVDAERVWKSSTSVPRRTWSRTLEPGDYIDAVLPGTSVLLVRNATCCTLRCFDAEIGASSSAAHLDGRLVCFSEVSSDQDEHRVAYLTQNKTRTRGVLGVFSIEPTSTTPQVVEIFKHVITEDFKRCLFLDGDLVGYLSMDEAANVYRLVALNIRSGARADLTLVVPGYDILALDDLCIVKKRFCLTMYVLNESRSEVPGENHPHRLMCFAPPHTPLPYEASTGYTHVTSPLVLVPLATWLPSEMDAFDDEHLDNARACAGDMGMTFELWTGFVCNGSNNDGLAFYTSAYEAVYHPGSALPTAFRARLSPHFLGLRDVQWHIRSENGRPAWSWYGPTLALPVISNSASDELRRIVLAHSARNPDDAPAAALAETARRDPHLLAQQNDAGPLSWGNLKIVQFSPVGGAEPHTCDLAVPSSGGQPGYEAVVLDATLAVVYLQIFTLLDGLKVSEVQCLAFTVE